MTDGEEDLEELRKQTEIGGRLDNEPGTDDRASDTETESDELAEDDTETEESALDSGLSRTDQLTKAIVAELDEIERGDQNKTVSVWDGEISALLAVLGEHPEERKRVSETLQEELGVHAGGISDRAEIVKMLLRVGLREADPELAASLQEAIKEHAAQTL